MEYIFTSDLERAKITAQKIQDNHKGSKLIISKLLREGSFGLLEGETWNKVDWKNLPDSVEGKEAMIKRAENFLNKYISPIKETNSSCVVVTHRGLMIALISRILSKNFEEIRTIDFDNTCVNIFDPYPVLEFLNDCSHLKSY